MKPLRSLLFSYYCTNIFTLIFSMMCILCVCSVLGITAFQHYLLTNFADQPEVLNRWFNGRFDNGGVFLPIWSTVFAGFSWFFLLFASVSIPASVEKMLKGKSFGFLPGVKPIVFISVLAPALLAATILFLQVWSFKVGFPQEIETTDYRELKAFLIGFTNFVPFLFALFIVGKAQGIWKLLGVFLLLLGVGLPLQTYNPHQKTLFYMLFAIGSLCWLVLAMLVFQAEKVRSWLDFIKSGLSATSSSAERDFSALNTRMQYAFGLIRVRPWLIALLQASTVVVAGWWMPDERSWLVYFVSFCAISGVMTATAVPKSRFFWLRDDSNREELWKKTERIYWGTYLQYMAVSLIAFACVAVYFNFTIRTMSLGFPLLILSSVVSFYLGLLLTRGTTWSDSIAILISLPLIVLTAFAVATLSKPVVIAIVGELVLLILVPMFRGTSKSHWRQLDWAYCR